ncbi:YARHG domain-containing protein [uncultured Treponema sp.]|nr:YARHG domain-containing protein [uncultured Treponema sp.]
MQALFNEYTWYTPDENYSDDKLTDTDLANIKLIQEFEEK